MAGGSGANDNILASAEIYDPTTGIWTATGSLATARYLHTATLLPNGQVLVAGGGFPELASAELYDPTTGMWMRTRSMNIERFAHTATLLSNGQVLVATGVGTGAVLLTSAELYKSAP